VSRVKERIALVQVNNPRSDFLKFTLNPAPPTSSFWSTCTCKLLVVVSAVVNRTARENNLPAPGQQFKRGARCEIACGAICALRTWATTNRATAKHGTLAGIYCFFSDVNHGAVPTRQQQSTAWRHRTDLHCADLNPAIVIATTFRGRQCSVGLCGTKRWVLNNTLRFSIGTRCLVQASFIKWQSKIRTYQSEGSLN